MANEIKVYGKLVNKTKDGILADASQIVVSEGNSVADSITNITNDIKNVTNEVTNVSNTIQQIPHPDNLATKEELRKAGVRAYESLEDAREDLDSLEYGSTVSINSGSEENYNAVYNLYTVSKNKENQKELRLLSTGSMANTGTVQFNVESLTIDGVESLTSPELEATLNSTIVFKCSFISSNYPDIPGTVYCKIGSNTIKKEKFYPSDDRTYTWTYDTAGMKSGIYTFTLYGVESTGRQTDRVNFRIMIGGLAVQSTFDEEKLLEVGKDIRIPVTVAAADTEAEITAYIDGKSTAETEYRRLLEKKVTVDTTSIDVLNDFTSGTYDLRIHLENNKGKISNTIEYTVIIAEEGLLYILLDKPEYTVAEGARLQFFVRTVQLLKEDSTFATDMIISDTEGNEVKKEHYPALAYGTNAVSVIGLKAGTYKATFIVKYPDSDETVSKTVDVIISENKYNIDPYPENLLCWFDAAGKSNISSNRDTWEDKSGNNTPVKLYNFNFAENGNGWLDDKDGNTALTINAGAYVEIDLEPFREKEVQDLTISIDFSTKDILDPNAKVVSCLQEGIGEESEEYYLRDAFGDYVEAGESNIVNYFNYAGGYCWVDGETKIADGVTEYKTTLAVSARQLNYNLGDANPAYNNDKDEKYDKEKPIDYLKCKGYSTKDVTVQRGFFVDTEVAVLTNSTSKTNKEDKFHLFFSEDTRTRIDLIIHRSGNNKEPYYFSSLIGYTNGTLSLMEELSAQSFFVQNPISGKQTFRIYLGGKGAVDANGQLKVTETGECRIYSFRIYNEALSPVQILKNYAAEIPDVDKKKTVIDNNDLLNAGTLAKLPQMCLYGYKQGTDAATGKPIFSIEKFIMQLKATGSDQVSDLKGMKEPAYVSYIDPNDESKTWKTDDNGEIFPIRLQFQGTSSMVYPVKNYKFKLYHSITESNGKYSYNNKENGDKVKKDIGNGVAEQTFCLKADFMDSSHSNNTGSAMFISDYNNGENGTGPTPAAELNPNIRTTIYGYPCLLYYKLDKDDTNEQMKFIGVYNLNLDKSCNDSFGLKGKVKDIEGVSHNFGKQHYFDDEYSQDILIKTDEEITLELEDEDSGEKYNETFIAMKMPGVDAPVALLDKDNNLRFVDGGEVDAVQCFEFKANTGKSGAGGFGDYSNKSVTKDLEARFPDDGDLEDENYEDYKKTTTTPITYEQYKSPLIYNMQRMIKWVCNSDKIDFTENLEKHFNKRYVMDYYLTIMTLGGVDSLGKNLMVASWGPENKLYITTENALNDAASNEEYDRLAFRYTDPIDGSEMILTPNKVKVNGKYKFAENVNGEQLFYKEECFSRYTQSFINKYTKFEVDTIPGEWIWYPIFYDIDTICGLDNAGQMIFDVDIEIGDQLADGTAVFNTADSNLWGRVREYLGTPNEQLTSELAERWSQLRLSKFTVENMINGFYYGRQIAKIPETYYNQDCFLKYVYEGPNPQKGSGTYLYCLHGSRYEQMKRWYSQRLNYLDSMFGKIGATSASLRFNHTYYDGQYGDTFNYYANYASIAQQYPDKYIYDGVTGKLYRNETHPIEVVPIEFKFKTYQPGYVGIKWYNGGRIHTARVSRNSTTIIKGNVKSAGDAEVFVYGGSNIKEIGDMSPFNVKSIQFQNLEKLSKLILGSEENKSVIQEVIVGTNKYLSELQVVNCRSLFSLDVKGCTNLRTIDMTNSSVSVIDLPTSGALETIKYSTAITTIDLNNFMNLTNVVTPGVNNLTSLSIVNCPKILGTKDSPSARAWNILQQTSNSKQLSSIKLEAYGQVAPAENNYFFLDKYYTINNSQNVRGEIYYTGTTVPVNYVQFPKAFPDLKVTYENITDASNMFADYKNITLIDKRTVYAGKEQNDEPKYITAYYWVDADENIRKKWYTQENYQKYGATTEYKYSTQFYIEDGVYYRMLDIYDDEDLDMLRAEIKSHVSAFTHFTNLTGMFKNLTVLDYMDPDTFNNVDISSAITDYMFAGCTNLKYFETPNDIVKSDVRYNYFFEDEYITKEEYEANIGVDGYRKEKYYVDPITNEIVDTETTIHKKGMRNIGERMFWNCNKVKVLLRHYNGEKITIKDNAFEHAHYNMSLETQSRDTTLYRPVILFQVPAEELLNTTTEDGIYSDDGELITKFPATSDGRYFELTTAGFKTFKTYNDYFIITSPRYLREVYFDIKDYHYRENLEGAKVSYFERNDGKKILTAVEGNISSFQYSTTNSEMNKLNIYSATVGSLSVDDNNLNNLNSINMVIPNFDNLDSAAPLADIEKVFATLFVNSKNCSIMDVEKVGSLVPPTLANINVVNTDVIPNSCFEGFSSLVSLGFDSLSVKEIGARAFARCEKLASVEFYNLTLADNSKRNTLRTIGNFAFTECPGLKMIDIPDNAETLGEGIFKDCTGLISAGFAKNIGANSEKITYIPKSMFENCTSLSTVNDFPETITNIDDRAFYNCKSLELLKPDGSCCFSDTTENNNFDYFTDLERIGVDAFYNVNFLVSSSLSDNDKPDESKTYYKLVLPETLKYIERNAFAQSINKAPLACLEIVWGKDVDNIDYDTAFEELCIDSNAFANIRTSWTNPSTNENIKDCIFIPRVAFIGKDAFKAYNRDTSFVYCLTRNKEIEIGSSWVNYTKKIIFEFDDIAIIEKDSHGENITKGKFLLSFPRGGNENSIGRAYFHSAIESQINALNIPGTVLHGGRKYKVVEVLSNAIDGTDEGNSLSMLTFGNIHENSELELIETDVLKSTKLFTIVTYDNGEAIANRIPTTLKIETGNNLKNTSWFESLLSSLSDGTFISLGRYIIGYNPTEEENNLDTGFSLDLRDESIANCDVIFDEAFKTLNINHVELPNNIKEIYSNSFYSCEKLDHINLPSNIEFIGKNAFSLCPIRELFLPKSLKEIESEAFLYSSDGHIGYLRKVDIEDGADIKGEPFALQIEATTGATPSEINISFREFHVPTSMNWLMTSEFDASRIMSQAHNLYLGALRINTEDPDGSEYYGTYMCPNIPIFIKEESEGVFVDTYEYTDVQKTVDGKPVYCPRFWYDIIKTSSYKNDTSLTTTETHSVVPLGDHGSVDGDGNYEFSGFNANIDLTIMHEYENLNFKPGVEAPSDITQYTRPLSRENLLRILAAFTSMGNQLYTVKIRQMDDVLTTTDIIILLNVCGKKITIERTKK